MDLYIFGGKILTPFWMIEDGTIRSVQGGILKMVTMWEQPRPSALIIDTQDFMAPKHSGSLKRRPSGEGGSHWSKERRRFWLSV